MQGVAVAAFSLNCIRYLPYAKYDDIIVRLCCTSPPALRLWRSLFCPAWGRKREQEEIKSALRNVEAETNIVKLLIAWMLMYHGSPSTHGWMSVIGRVGRARNSVVPVLYRRPRRRLWRDPDQPTCP